MAKRGIDRQIRCSGRHVQQPEGVEENHLPGGEATPGDVAAKTQQVIQEIVPAGDRCKDLPDHADVFLAADPGYRRVAILILHPRTLPPKSEKAPHPGASLAKRRGPDPGSNTPTGVFLKRSVVAVKDAGV